MLHLRKLLILFLLTVPVKTMGDVNVWFPWLDHVPTIQAQWTKTQDEAFSIWNNISRFQPFEQYERQIGEVLMLIDAMEKQKNIDEKTYSTKYSQFFRLSDEYVSAMRNVIAQLQHVMKKLKEKSEDLESYSWHQYQHDLDQYNRLLSLYRQIGARMNKEFQRIQSVE